MSRHHQCGHPSYVAQIDEGIPVMENDYKECVNEVTGTIHRVTIARNEWRPEWSGHRIP
jgi:hypothetical protein